MVEVRDVPCCTAPEATEDMSVKVGGGIVRITVVVALNRPIVDVHVPVMVTLYMPGFTDPFAVNVSELVPVGETGFGENDALMPVGKPEAVRLMLPVSPFSYETTMSVSAEELGATVTEPRPARMEKDGWTIVRAMFGAYAASWPEVPTTEA